MSVDVFFIGGYNAKQIHINWWKQSAQQQAQPGIGFKGFPWPDGVVSSPATAVVQGWRDKRQFQPVVDAVQASQADFIYIVGHSSGCAVANAVDNALSNTSKIVLVALDGFPPDEDQRKRPSTQVWSAVNPLHPAVQFARNYKKLKALLGSELHEYRAKDDCTSTWALHFSLVNSAATDTLVQGVETGYNKCEANLIWMWNATLNALVTGMRSIL
jgi:ABC-type branched-subunit amino acid transport system substrate-binding protein